MVSKFMYIPNNDTQNYPICKSKSVVKRLNTQLNKLTNLNLLKSPKLLSKQIRKHYTKTSKINNLLSHLSLVISAKLQMDSFNIIRFQNMCSNNWRKSLRVMKLKKYKFMKGKLFLFLTDLNFYS